MLDVIEHVNDPVSLLSEYSRFLKHDGQLVITTPNAHRSIDFLNIIRSNDYGLNYEHSLWFCPLTFIEVVERVSFFEINSFSWLEHYYIIDSTHRFGLRVRMWIDQLLWKSRKNFSPNFMFVLKLTNDKNE